MIAFERQGRAGGNASGADGEFKRRCDLRHQRQHIAHAEIFEFRQQQAVTAQHAYDGHMLQADRLAAVDEASALALRARECECQGNEDAAVGLD